MGGRFTSLIIVIFVVYAGLLARLYDLQVNQGKTYSAKAASQGSALQDTASRGTIYFTDKDGKKLPAALNKDYPTIYAVPKVIEDPRATANQAALILGEPADTLLGIFSRKNSAYAPLVKMADPELAKKVDEAKIKGLYTQEVPHRFYPFGTLAAHVLGFAGPNPDNNGVTGKYGLEKLRDKDLAGNGEDLVLTIDPAIQTEVEHIIKNLVTAHRAKSASVIVADPKTGKILAMGATPTFDPNDYSASPVKNFINPLVENIYEPGSVFKVLTMVAAIDTGKVSPDTTFNDTGTLVVNGHTIRNWDLRAHGNVTMTEVIEGSINTGAAFAERMAGNEVFKSYLQNLGFGQKTGIDLPGELAGSLSTLKAGAPEINYATASFGQGVSATAVQVLQAIGSIANGGVLMRPYLNADMGPEAVRRVMSAETARKVSGMMVSAVDTAGVTKIDGYSVAGKTGTAQVPDFVRGGYTTDVVDTYVGFAPAADPKFIALIRLNEPEGAPHAAETVVPAFRNVAQFLLNYYNVPPDRLADTKN